MKTIKLILLAMMVGLSCFGANEGKAQFSKIKANQYVVTNEVDSVFTQWRAQKAIEFPKATTSTFLIGSQSLADLLSGIVTKETDPTFLDTSINFKNATSVSFPKATTNTFVVGEFKLGDFVLRKELEEIEFDEMSVQELQVNGHKVEITSEGALKIDESVMKASSLDGVKTAAQTAIDALNDDTKTPDLPSVKKVMIEFLQTLIK